MLRRLLPDGAMSFAKNSPSILPEKSADRRLGVPMAKRKISESHVRLYRHELESAAYQSLPCDARALLIEFRALFTGKENRIFMSVREAMIRTGLGQRRAQHAIADLLERGFIRLLTKGTFHHKVRHASLYQLTSEPADDRDGSVPTKDFMRWQPKKHGSHHDYSAVAATTTAAPSDPPENGQNCSCHDYSKRQKTHPRCSHHGYIDMLPLTAVTAESVPECSKRARGSRLRLVTP